MHSEWATLLGSTFHILYQGLPSLLTCHCSGYDFGYLLKILTCQPLPTSEAEFFELLSLYFPNIFDIKYLMKFCDNLHGGLNKLAEMLEVSSTSMWTWKRHHICCIKLPIAGNL